MRRIHVLVMMMAILLGAGSAWGKSKEKKAPPAAADSAQSAQKEAIIDRIFYQEAKLGETMQTFTPMVETYIQNLKPDADMGMAPSSDAYFLGRLVLNEKGLHDQRFVKKTGFRSRILDRLNNFYKMSYLPLGFMQLVMLNNNFDREHYDMRFLRTQFLGEVRTLVFDVTPKPHQKGPNFLGRIWVEDQDYNIIRFNGTYENHARSNYFFHFDTWRENLQPGVWLPVYVYTEESDTRYMFVRKLSMKGQTRLWGYDRKHSGREDELTAVRVEADEVADHSNKSANEYNPVDSQHMWQREAEDNVLDRLERAGVLAPDGGVSKVLQTVVNNLEVTNDLNIVPAVRCRVLLTTPLESFVIGHTIVVSRGLLDTLPDEASLAMVLAHELGHIALGHEVDTRYGFSDRMLFPDENTFREFVMARKGPEEQDADKKGLEMLAKSPYKDKLQNAGLFLRALQDRSAQLHWLITPETGNRLAEKDAILRGAPLLQSAPQLEKRNTAQMAALPLGSRISLDSWDDHVEMKTTAAAVLESARDKMPFEVTPAFPNLVRFEGVKQESARNASSATPAK